jgi:hypothetical protein
VLDYRPHIGFLRHVGTDEADAEPAFESGAFGFAPGGDNDSRGLPR